MSNKPQITVTVSYKGQDIKMTAAEARELRDILNTIVGEPQRVVERVTEHHHHDHYPRPWYPYPNQVWISSGNWSVTSGGLSLGNTVGGISTNTLAVNPDDVQASYTIALN